MRDWRTIIVTQTMGEFVDAFNLNSESSAFIDRVLGYVLYNGVLYNGDETIGRKPIAPLTNIDLSGLLSRDKKIVAFVGTSKNGTSFLVNSLAEMLSQQGIKTALLDLTQNKNAYYIYTQNDESLREIAFKSIDSLRKGNPAGITVNKNLTVYTTLPGENEDINDYANILETLLKNYSLILLDFN